MSAITFPSGFVWGAASSAYQIEGAAREDGKGESIWDRFAHEPGRIKDGSTGDIACDGYHRYPEDVALMKDLGLGAYRFSTSWPRILPSGTGQISAKGLDFYSRLIDALLAAGIEPWITLYHWDMPWALYERGGFTVRAAADWFGEYADVVGRALGDRVKRWITFNEPQVFSTLGYLTAEHAPGLVDFPGYVAVAHHVHLAHGRAVQALRTRSKAAKVGIVEQVVSFHPSSPSEEDARAARRIDGVFNRFFLDAVLKGHYSSDILELLSVLPLPVEPGDFELIREPIDFVGVNHYTRHFVRHDPSVPLFEVSMDQARREPGSEYTDMGWEVYPPALGEVLTRLRTEYGNPAVVITENGCALRDVVEDGAVHDPRRIAYLRSYLAEVNRQIALGSRVEGYFVWSFTDNFEWAEGYGKRFGLVYVDYATGRRIPKDSARWYGSIAKTGSLSG